MSAPSAPDGQKRHPVGPATSGRPSYRAGLGRRSLSLRARLLIGLIALTAVFLVVMGVVSTVVLGRTASPPPTCRCAPARPAS
jgi:hypothetical protein